MEPDHTHTFQVTVHRVRARDINVSAHEVNGTRWINLMIANHEITFFANSAHEFTLLCERLGISEPGRPTEEDLAWEQWRLESGEQ